MAEANWIRIQKKTFARWCNTYLIERNLAIANLETDLSDGVALHNLIEILAGEKIMPKPNKLVKLKVQKVEQINRILRFVQAKGIKLVGIGGQDIHDGNVKLILGLVWILILRFQISMSDEVEGSTKSALLDWCNKVLKPQGIEVKDFKGSWQDGRAFCGLVNALESESINLDDCTPDKAEANLNLAFDKANELFQFPKMLDAEDVLVEPDDLSMMCYISYFRGYMTTNTACAAYCYAEGPGLKEGLVLKPAEFKVFIRNDQNEPATKGGAPVRAFLKDENDQEVCRVGIIDNRDGTYSGKYECPRPGTFTLSVRVAKNEIKGSPFNPSIISGEPYPGKCSALGAGAKTAVAGQVVEFKIQAKDMNGNNLDKGGANFTATFKDPKETIQIKIKDNGDGTYSGSYTPTTAGSSPLIIEVSTEAFGEGPIEGSPYNVQVLPGSPVAENTTASGPGLNGCPAGETGVVTVTTRDEFGNTSVSGGAPIKAVLTSLVDRIDVPVDVVDQNNGTYTLSYVPKKVGSYQLEITLNGSPIKDAPFQFDILPGRPDASKFEISGIEYDGNGKKVLVAGVTDKFKVSARDLHGNVIPSGGLDVSGVISGPEAVDVVVTDNKDGTYEVSYTPTKVGEYSLDVKVEGNSVGGKNPVPLYVLPGGADGSNSIAFGPGLETASIEGENTFTVKSFDQFGNPLIAGGAKVGGTVTSKYTEPIQIQSTDNGDGTYTCFYPGVEKAGDYEIVPTLNGTPVKDAPFKLRVNPGSFNLDSTSVEFDDTAVAGLPGAHVHLKDARNNHLLSGGESVEATLLPLTDLSVQAIDKGDGTYDLVYPPHVKGQFEVSVFVNDQPAPGGPWNVDVQESDVPEDVKSALSGLVSNDATSAWLQVLALATPAERQIILSELKSL
eukprot:TRINITY_DN189_c0_g1_i1.p1 TRINITY_DN189_c0_g1~~TRINITY_DN189_c0_g1_i1.p1  ORF type:complete len:897 (-),score=291.77 TRINITY_DN189_c0_g1_i1:46-2736(-)